MWRLESIWHPNPESQRWLTTLGEGFRRAHALFGRLTMILVLYLDPGATCRSTSAHPPSVCSFRSTGTCRLPFSHRKASRRQPARLGSSSLHTRLLSFTSSFCHSFDRYCTFAYHTLLHKANSCIAHITTFGLHPQQTITHPKISFNSNKRKKSRILCVNDSFLKAIYRQQ